MTGGMPAADEMRRLIGVTLVGAALLVAGTLLGFATAVMGLAGPFGLPHPRLVAGALIAAALMCGLAVVALAVPGCSSLSRAGHVRRLR